MSKQEIIIDLLKGKKIQANGKDIKRIDAIIRENNITTVRKLRDELTEELEGVDAYVYQLWGSFF